MEITLTFKNRQFQFNTVTEEVFAVSSEDKLTPMSINHPSLHGLKEEIDKKLATES